MGHVLGDIRAEMLDSENIDLFLHISAHVCILHLLEEIFSLAPEGHLEV